MEGFRVLEIKKSVFENNDREADILRETKETADIFGISHLLHRDCRTLSGGEKVLTAAAMTYVAALFTSILQLVRLILLFNGTSRRR